MRIGTWNIQALRGASRSRLEAIVDVIAGHDIDVATLQEVGLSDVADRLVAELARVGLVNVLRPTLGHTDATRPKSYGTLLASRWPVTAVTWPRRLTWPQLLTAGDVHHGAVPFRLIGVHAPNGTGNGWEKVYAFEALSAGLDASTRATIVAGDFNEPKSLLPEFASFRRKRSGLDGDFQDRFGVTQPRVRWETAVARVLHPDDAERGWPGQHAAVQCGVAFEPTHLVGGRSPRYFDHILTTPDLPVRGVDYDHSVRLGHSPLSDHSLVVAEIDP